MKKRDGKQDGEKGTTAMETGELHPKHCQNVGNRSAEQVAEQRLVVWVPNWVNLDPLITDDDDYYYYYYYYTNYIITKLSTIIIRTTYYIFCMRNKPWTNPDLLSY